jgi:alanine racemase
MTHFACADEPANPVTSAQIACFNSATETYSGDKSLANSAAILNSLDAHADWIRPGIMLYGASPFIDQTGKETDLKPVMTLTSQIISLRTIPAGESVGYGATWTAQRTSRVAAVGIGYGDGYPRQVQPGTPVWVGGQAVPLIGRVSMDSITVDVTELAQVSVGDSVELWGPNLPVETVAAHCGTISYHLFCGVTSRVPRVYRG